MTHKYQVVPDGTMVQVIDTRTGKGRTYSYAEFIYGQMHHNPDTDLYPDYVHGDVWDLWDRNQKHVWVGEPID